MDEVEMSEQAVREMEEYLSLQYLVELPETDERYAEGYRFEDSRYYLGNKNDE